MNVRVCNKTRHNRGREEVHSASCLAMKISLEAEMTSVAAESRIILGSFLEIEGQVRQTDLKELWTRCPREPISMVCCGGSRVLKRGVRIQCAKSGKIFA